MIPRFAILLLICCLTGCALLDGGRQSPGHYKEGSGESWSAIMPPVKPAMYSANSVITPPAPKEILIPLSYPQDVTSYTWSIYGAPSVSGPWTLLASNLIGEPAGMMDVPGYGNAGFYKIVSQKL